MDQSAGSGTEFVVPFDRAVLTGRRRAMRRVLLVSGITFVPMLLVMAWMTLAAATLASWLAAILLFLLLMLGYVAAASWHGYWRTSYWGRTAPPEVALRMTTEGLWLAIAPTGAVYPWSAVTELKVAAPLFQPCLLIGLRPGAAPDRPVILGLEEADVHVRARRLLGFRRPRLMLDLTTATGEDILAAARQLSAGHTGCR